MTEGLGQSQRASEMCRKACYVPSLCSVFRNPDGQAGVGELEEPRQRPCRVRSPAVIHTGTCQPGWERSGKLEEIYLSNTSYFYLDSVIQQSKLGETLA